MVDNGYGYVPKTVMITKEQNDWIDKRESVNFSGLIRELLQRYMDKEEARDRSDSAYSAKQPAQTKLTD